MQVMPVAVKDVLPAAGERAGRIRSFLVICLELVLLLAAVYLFDIEGQRFFLPVLGLACAGFLVHAWLPARFRLAFFAVLSLAGILLFLGWIQGAYVIGIGCGLIALCQLPVPLAIRVGLVLVAALVLMMWRVETPAPFWPVLGSMFMFRLIVYLYDQRHERRRPPLAQTLAYFFPLPNVCFTLFPILDFKTFRETYQADDAYRTYQTGIEWMVRGLSHLLLYRLIKYYFLPSPFEVRDLPHLLLFLATNYALYLRISGQFHLITGMLHLFGFGLPRTHDNYFLAASFTDIWRRINIYWKDFMAKVFFFPAFFTLRPLGTRLAMALAAGWVFLWTWLLHSYQVFWLLGDLPVTANDAVLWLLVGLLVAANLQLDLRRAARPGAVRAGFHLLGAAVLSLRVLGMFFLVSLFWACWAFPEFAPTLRQTVFRRGSSLHDVLWLLGLVTGVVAVGVLFQFALRRLRQRGLWQTPLSFQRSALIQCAALAVLVAATLPRVGRLFGPAPAELVATLRLDKYSPAELAQVVRGYYEEVANTRLQAGAFLESMTLPEEARRPAERSHYPDATRPTDELLGRELIPGWRGTLGGSPITINELGMRDRRGISKHKPANTCRIALVGSSIVMGYGVADDEVFKCLLEDRLNEAAPAGGPRYELLNFGAGLTYVIHRRTIIERKVFAFEPDMLFYFAHQDEVYRAASNVAGLLATGTPLPYPWLTEVVEKAGITPDTPAVTLENLLIPFRREILLGVYRGLAEECRQRALPLVWVYLPMPGVKEISVKASEVVDVAREAGFEVVNLEDWASGQPITAIKLQEDDHHPNANGHRIIAGQLFAELSKRPELLPRFARLKP